MHPENFLMNNRNPNKGDGLAVASLVCGIFGCVIMCSVIFSVFFGALAIFFALIGRGDSMKMTKQCRSGFILGVLAIIFSGIIFALSVRNIIVNYGSVGAAIDAFNMMLNETALNLYGVTFDQMLQMQ